MSARRHVDIVIPDPGIRFGRFRVLPRTDGRWCVWDPKAPLGVSAAVEATEADAVEAAKELAKQAGEGTGAECE